MNKYVLFCIKHPILAMRQNKAINELSDLCSGYENEIQKTTHIKQDMSYNCCHGYDYIIMNQRYIKGLSSYDEWKHWYNTHCANCTYMCGVCQYSKAQRQMRKEVE